MEEATYTGAVRNTDDSPAEVEKVAVFAVPTRDERGRHEEMIGATMFADLRKRRCLAKCQGQTNENANESGLLGWENKKSRDDLPLKCPSIPEPGTRTHTSL